VVLDARTLSFLKSTTPTNQQVNPKSLLEFETDVLLGFGVTNVGLPGMKPFSMERIALSRPEIPAAGSECPTLLFIWHEELH
jgi:hypothetical protein